MWAASSWAYGSLGKGQQLTTALRPECVCFNLLAGLSLGLFFFFLIQTWCCPEVPLSFKFYVSCLLHVCLHHVCAVPWRTEQGQGIGFSGTRVRRRCVLVLGTSHLQPCPDFLPDSQYPYVTLNLELSLQPDFVGLGPLYADIS